MRVLGISPLDKDATASFMEDGKVIFACGEERLSRTKLQDGFPYRSVKLGLELTGWSPGSIDQVAYAFFDGEREAQLMREAAAEDAALNRPRSTAKSLAHLQRIQRSGYQVDRSREIPGIDTLESEFMPRRSLFKRVAYKLFGRFPSLDWLAHKRFYKEWISGATADHHKRTEQLARGLEEFGWSDKLSRFNHHDTHAANAFYSSGFEDALLVTLDGYGSGNCGGIYRGGADGIQPLHLFKYPNSLGQYYEHVTSGLGFRPSRHEGKIVGLAAYGNPDHLRDVLRERFVCKDGDIRIRANLNYYFTRTLSADFAKRDISAAYQSVLEEVTTEVVSHWVKSTGLSQVAVSGGVHANVKLNQRIHEIDGVSDIFVYPNMGDGGCATGAAMLVFPASTFRGKSIDTAYYGPEYSDFDIRQSLEEHQLEFEDPEDVEKRIAEVLNDNHIVARFNGRMEYGPRALGNRSVLYPAQDPEVNQWLNHQLGRTEFMPFAPAVLASEARRLFKRLDGCQRTAEFMTITLDCTEEMIESCPAAVHVDGTARPQLVDEHSNKSFYSILQHYYKLSGVPVLINTSFNMHEEPIVCSPEDAIRAFLMGRIDYLAIGSFLVPHPHLTENLKERGYTEARGSAHAISGSSCSE